MRILVQKAAFDAAAELAKITQNRVDIGAITSFIGLVRDFNTIADNPQKVTRLSLEHYPGMTEKTLKAIAGQAVSRWDLQDLCIIHRVGDLAPGDPIVLVITAAAHRQAAFAACEAIMDVLKTQAPFWKKETKLDASQHWVEARNSDQQAAQRWQDKAG